MVLIRPAKQSDAPILAELIDMAGAGLPAYLWSLLGDHTDDELDVGAARIARTQGTMSHTNIRVALVCQKIAGMMHGYHLKDQDDVGPLRDYPEFLRPLLELESLSSTAWYHNAMATLEEFRGRARWFP